jgi:hypothetical protein
VHVLTPSLPQPTASNGMAVALVLLAIMAMGGVLSWRYGAAMKRSGCAQQLLFAASRTRVSAGLATMDGARPASDDVIQQPDYSTWVAPGKGWEIQIDLFGHETQHLSLSYSAACTAPEVSRKGS